MVSVDDLVISLRIDETSNLGKLQKQLTALVGPKGEKAAEFGLDPDLKRDLKIMKDRIIRFTPTVLVGENIKEAALDLAADLRTNKNLTEVMLQRYNINIDKYETFIDELLNISMGISKMNSDQAKGFVAEMAHWRMIADMDKGRRETFIKRLTRMKLEAGFHINMVKAFREAGIKLLSKPPMFELTKKSIGKGFDDAIREGKLAEPEKFEALKKIFDDNTDDLKAINEAYFYMKEKVFDITEVTAEMIQNDKDLRLIILAQVASAIKKSNRMVEEFYKASKSFFTGGKGFGVAGAAIPDIIIHRIAKEAMEELGIEHVVGDKIDENMVNFLGELKTVAGKTEADYEFTKRMIKQGSRTMFFFFEEFTDGMKNYIEEVKRKEEYKGWKVGGYKLLTRAVDKILGIETDLEEKERKARKQLDDEKERTELSEAERKADMEGLEEFMLTAEEGGQAITELGGDVSDLVKTTEKGFLDQAKKFMDIEGKEDEILERIKKKEEAKTKDPEVVKEDK